MSETENRHRDVLLATERLGLRALTAGDLDDLVALDSDPEVMRFLTGGRPTPRRTLADEHLPRFLRRHPRTGLPGFWAAEEKGRGRFLGWFELRPLDDDLAVAELGYRLRRDSWGHGYATEGARALLAPAFTEWGVRRVVATTMTVNAASRRVMEKVGLRCVRTVFGNWPEAIAGSEHGEVEYELSRDVWLGSTATT